MCRHTCMMAEFGQAVFHALGELLGSSTSCGWRVRQAGEWFRASQTSPSPRLVKMGHLDPKKRRKRSRRVDADDEEIFEYVTAVVHARTEFKSNIRKRRIDMSGLDKIDGCDREAFVSVGLRNEGDSCPRRQKLV